MGTQRQVHFQAESLQAHRPSAYANNLGKRQARKRKTPPPQQPPRPTGAWRAKTDAPHATPYPEISQPQDSDQRGQGFGCTEIGGSSPTGIRLRHHHLERSTHRVMGWGVFPAFI